MMKYHVGIAFVVCFVFSGCGGDPAIPTDYGNPFPSTTLTPFVGEPPTSAPPPQSNKAITNQGVLCYSGPDAQYQPLFSLSVDSEVNIIKVNSDDGSWFFVEVVSQGNSQCWIEAQKLTYSLSPDLKITVVAIQESICRLGPSEIWSIQTRIAQGRRVIVVGMSDYVGTWLLVIPTDSSVPCWVAAYSLSRIDIFVVPLSPTTTPHPVSNGNGNNSGNGAGEGNGENGTTGGTVGGGCQNVQVCEDKTTKIDVCVDWAGNSGNCKKWEQQDVVNNVCNMVCK